MQVNLSPKSISAHLAANGGIPLGNQTEGADLTSFDDAGCRTQEQFEAVHRLHNAIPFSFWCNNPFIVDIPGETYSCTFAHLFYVGEELVAAKITPKGRVKVLRKKIWYSLEKDDTLQQIPNREAGA